MHFLGRFFANMFRFGFCCQQKICSFPEAHEEHAMLHIGIVLVVVFNQHFLDSGFQHSTSHTRVVACACHDFEKVVLVVASIRVDTASSETVLCHLEASPGHTQRLHLGQAVQVNHYID